MEHFHINFEFSLPVRDWHQEAEQVHTFLCTLIAITLTERMTISRFIYGIGSCTY